MASLYLTWIHVCSSIFTLNHILQIGRQRWISLSGDPGKIQFYDGTISLSLRYILWSRACSASSLVKRPGKVAQKEGAPECWLARLSTKTNNMRFWVTECRYKLCRWLCPRLWGQMAQNLCGISIFDERLSTPEESTGTESDGHLKYTLYTQCLENHNCRFGSVCSPSSDIVA